MASTNKDLKPTQVQNPLTAAFREHADYLNSFNERREHLVKASRDVTQASKKAIFELHRLNASNRDVMLKRGHKTSVNIRSIISKRIATNVSVEDYYRFRQAFTPGLQEYIESRTFLNYLENGTLMSLDDISQEIASACTIVKAPPLRITLEDYILGIADLTGELMRRAVADASGEGFQILAFLRFLSNSMESFTTKGNVAGREMHNKMETFRRSLKKVEKACFDNRIRRAELNMDINEVDEHDRKRQKVAN